MRRVFYDAVHRYESAVNEYSLDFSASSSLRLRLFQRYFARSSSTRGLDSTSLASMLLRLCLPFRGVFPGSRKARENSSFRLSLAILGVAAVEYGGSKSESGSELAGNIDGLA